MRIDSLDVMAKNDLATVYRQTGMASIANVDLPDTFVPSATDVILLAVQGECEIYIGSNVIYNGRSRQWRRIMRQEPSPGGTRKIMSLQGDLFTGVSRLKALLEEADDGHAASIPGTVVAVGTPTPEVPAQIIQPPIIRDVDTPLPNAVPTASQNSGPGTRSHTLRDLVEDCHRHPRCFAGRDDLLRTLKTNLIRESKPGIILLGKEGVGKTAIVEMLASDIACNRHLPPALQNVSVFDLPLGAIVENGRYSGEIERQARQVFDLPGRPIFFVDEIHQLARQELSGLRDIIKPALAQGWIRVIGATTIVEWRKIEDNAFKRRFLEMNVDEPSPQETFLMLIERIKILSLHHNLSINEDVIKEAIMLSARYMPRRQFPDKAIDVLDLAGALQTTSDEPVKKQLNKTNKEVCDHEHSRHTAGDQTTITDPVSA